MRSRSASAVVERSAASSRGRSGILGAANRGRQIVRRQMCDGRRAPPRARCSSPARARFPAIRIAGSFSSRRRDLNVFPRRIAVEKAVHQLRNIRAALAQARQMDASPRSGGSRDPCGTFRRDKRPRDRDSSPRSRARPRQPFRCCPPAELPFPAARAAISPASPAAARRFHRERSSRRSPLEKARPSISARR